MIYVTKKIEGAGVHTLGFWINLGIDWSRNFEQRKKKFKVRNVVRKNTIEHDVVAKGACLIASVNEIYSWMAENTPKDSRLKNRVSSKFDDEKTVWGIDFNSYSRRWELVPLRSAGKSTFN